MTITGEDIAFGAPLSSQIVFIDGVFGSGKSLLSPFVSSIPTVARTTIEETIEHVLILNSMGLIDDQALKFLIEKRADIRLFNSFIGRETNLRYSDDTGLKFYPNKMSELVKIFKTYVTSSVENDIKIQNSRTSLMIHNCGVFYEKIFELIGMRTRFIETVRHPTYLFEHWITYLERISDSSCDFDLYLTRDSGASQKPWFLSTVNASTDNVYDLTLLALERLLLPVLKQKTGLCEKAFFLIPFENFVLDTEDWLASLGEFLGCNFQTRAFRKIARTQLCPRNSLNDGLGKKQYGFDRGLIEQLDEVEDYRRRKDQIYSGLSGNYIERFETLCLQYEMAFFWPRQMPWNRSNDKF